jgi:hypothetical protein
MKSNEGQRRDRGVGLRGELEAVLLHGARAAGIGRDAGVGRAAEAVADLAVGHGLDAVGTEVATIVGGMLASKWEWGWQPAEIARAVRRRRGGRHEDLVVTAMADDSAWGTAGVAAPAAWRAQLDDLGVTRWWGGGPDWFGLWCRRAGVSFTDGAAVVIEVLGVVGPMQPMARIIPPPSQWSTPGWTARGRRSGPPADDAVLAKVRLLLAKAESTSFEAEAEALSAKAQELMTRHAIDEALARQGGGDRSDAPSVRRLPVDDPYATAKSSLLHVVAAANGVQSVWHPAVALMAIVGFDGDLDAVEVLFTSLLVQATRAMLSEGRVVDSRGHARTRSFRRSFLLAYAGRIAERLAAAATSARRQAEDELGVALVPVLARRDEDVEAAVRTLFPRVRHAPRPSVSNREGWSAGRRAAERAHLGPDRRHLPGRASA